MWPNEEYKNGEFDDTNSKSEISNEFEFKDGILYCM